VSSSREKGWGGAYIQDNTPMFNRVIYHKGVDIIQGSILPRIATFNIALGIAFS